VFLSEVAGSLDGRNSQQMAAYSDYPSTYPQGSEKRRASHVERWHQNFTFGPFMVPYTDWRTTEMNITNDIKPVTYLKSRAADLLNQINETQRPVIITQNGEPRAILQDPKSYENMRNAIGILKLISEGEANVREGRVKSQDDVFIDIENGLKANHK
jgi:prevent-host-death family protein